MLKNIKNNFLIKNEWCCTEMGSVSVRSCENCSELASDRILFKYCKNKYLNFEY